MIMLKFLIFSLTFYQLIVNLDGICPKGHMVNREGPPGCVICLEGYFQPQPQYSKRCLLCKRCNIDSGSFIKKDCTRETDTICQCRGDFIPRDDDSSTCECAIGYGKKDGVCSKCEIGSFNKIVNSPCRKWKECKSGVKIAGNLTSDVVCNEGSKYSTFDTTPTTTTTTKVISLITQLKTQRPHESGAHMPTPTTNTRSVPGSIVTPTDQVQPGRASNTGSLTGMALLIFGIVGLLVLTAVTCKLNLASCREKNQALQNQDSCRRPVEESGDDSLSSLKLNPGEA